VHLPRANVRVRVEANPAKTSTSFTAAEFVRLPTRFDVILMGAAASVTSDRSDEKFSVRTAEDLCDAGSGTIAYPSPKGSAPHSLCSLSSPTGLFDAEVPVGTIPGQLFDISIDGTKFSIRCPSGKLPGDLISFTLGSGTSLRKVLTGKQSKQLIVVE
jgi:hypothetical protein